jgi:hypothetical protein
MNKNMRQIYAIYGCKGQFVAICAGTASAPGLALASGQ